MNLMNQEAKKQAVSRAALDYIENGQVVGIGTGSTTNFFIDELAKIKGRIDGTVASSQATTSRLQAHGIPVFDLNAVDEVNLYIDGADECTPYRHLLKGGGGGHLRERKSSPP